MQNSRQGLCCLALWAVDYSYALIFIFLQHSPSEDCINPTAYAGVEVRKVISCPQPLAMCFKHFNAIACVTVGICRSSTATDLYVIFLLRDLTHCTMICYWRSHYLLYAPVFTTATASMVRTCKYPAIMQQGASPTMVKSPLGTTLIRQFANTTPIMCYIPTELNICTTPIRTMWNNH